MRNESKSTADVSALELPDEMPVTDLDRDLTAAPVPADATGALRTTPRLRIPVAPGSAVYLTIPLPLG